MTPAPTLRRASFRSNESIVDSKRSSRACDSCRKIKSKCKRSQNPNKACVSCQAAGADCTYEGPRFKRGPPKGYIHAIEQRLRQVESVLGTIVGSQDPRARGLIAELKRDGLANEIIHRVDSGPFGPTGRRLHRGSSQEALLATVSQPDTKRESRVMRENVSVTVTQDHIASPTLEWQENLLTLLHQAQYVPQESIAMSDNSNSGEFNALCTSEGELASAVGKLSVDENEQYRFHDESSGMPMLNRSNSKRLDDRNRGGIWRLPLSRHVSEQCETLADDIEESLGTMLPPMAEQDLLIEIYFTYVHPILPVVHKTSFMAAYKASRKGQNDDAMDEVPSDMQRCKEKLSTLLLLAMFAIASRYNGPERDRTRLKKGQTWEAGQDYFTSARQVLDVVFRKSSIIVCQSVVLLAYCEFGMGSLEQAWIYTGIAIRMAQSLGLHRDADKWRLFNLDVFSPMQKEERKLVCIACALGRPVAITEGNYDTKLPEFTDGGTFAREEEEIWAPDPSIRPELRYKAAIGRTISCLKACASLSIIVGEIVEKLYSLRPESSPKHIEAYDKLEKMLDQWYTDLPDTLTLERTDIATPNVFTLHLQYWSAVILLRRKFIPSRDAANESMNALELCQGASSQISMIATTMKESHSLAATCPFFASYLFTAGIVHVATLSREPSKVHAEVGLAQVMTALLSMENVWQIASRNWELLNGAKVRIAKDAYTREHTGRQGRPSVGAVEMSHVDSTRWMAYMLGLNIPGVDLPQLSPAQTMASTMTTAPESTQGSATDVIMAGMQPDVTGINIGGDSGLLSDGALDYYATTLEATPDPSVFPTFDGYDFETFTSWDHYQG